jgi:hypothetical protein
MRTLALALVTMAGLGCSSEPTATPIEPDRPAAEQPGPGPGAGVTPLTSGAAGPSTPVVGTESVQGSGSGVGQAAKDKARGVASGGTTSLDSGE